MSEKTKQNQTRLFDYPEVNKQRSKFNLDYKNKMSCNLGKIYPTLCKETLPDDDWRIKTDFFTRWLALDAPVFSEYKLRFNNFFVPNIQVWKGWAQFMGNGDTASAEYLLPDGQEFVSKVPYITTKNFARAMVHSMLVPQQVSVLGNDVPVTAPRTLMKDFVVIGLPFLAWNTSEGFDMWAEIENDVAYPFNANGTPDLEDVPYWGFFFAPYNDYVKDLEAQQLCYIFSGGDIPLSNINISQNDEFKKVWKKWQRTQTAFYYDGFDISSVSENMNLLPLPHDILPLSADIVRISEVDGQTVWNYGAGYATSLTSIIKHSYGAMCAQRIPVSGQDTFAFTENKAPVGYQFVLIESDRTVSTLDVEVSLLASHGQRFVKHYLGSGTLSDYLGNVFSHTLKRQPEESYNYIMGNSPNWTRDFVPRGTYDSVSSDIEIGVCNDEPISLLPYLCYHKCWTDLFRDSRYELRYIYSDPYKSIFLIPDGDGRFVDGDMLAMVWGNYPEFANKNAYTFPQSPNIQMLESNDVVNHSNYFTFESLISLFSLRERRVVHDYYTLMSPNAQYGDAIGVSVVSTDLVLAGSQTDYRTPNNEFKEVMVGGDTLFVKEGNGTNPDFPLGAFVGLKSSVSVSALRLAGALQRFMERNNIVGSDYLKQILTHYGVSPRECQHCDTIYLGGDKFSPIVEPVDMVSSNTNTQVTGQQSGQMYVDGHCGDINYKTFEHGYILQMVTVQNDFNSTQGLQRQRIDKYDFAFPEFANLGAEAVPLSKVVNTDGLSGQNSYAKTTFGYAPRYSDYKCSLDEVHGDFRKSLRYWVSVRQFNPNLIRGTWGLGQKGNLPELGENFLYENPDYNAFAYSGEDSDHCLLDINHFVSVTRSLPMLPTPSIN